ncbi:hydroxyisourate hydrolase [Pseudomarimonas arenosa]|uniref:5-hydroxyisourate hydrolase n=1 Tax=Pseudomarimonas arenosa TaxID=2774145 RepID=A0AAW3ZMT7_9GAMM|nr:hydroxyisourate hydrolase [Pseudomarimonas arenosa]MBD8525621.1 hydroxyisourate hydrolase [Pseudomarimonas arenosa]
MPNGKLTTHILDTAHGRPGAGMVLELSVIENRGRRSLGRYTSNSDGRCDAPLLQGDTFVPGIYELDFQAGDYFQKLGLSLAEPKFLDVITLRFGIADANAHYHVPLLVSPYSYSTYRGS